MIKSKLNFFAPGFLLICFIGLPAFTFKLNIEIFFFNINYF